MILKKLFFVLVLSVCMLFAFSLAAPKDSESATLPAVMFDSDGYLYVSITDLGTIFGSEWELIATTDATGTEPLGLGLRNYNVSWSESVATIFEDDYWFGQAMTLLWTGDGSAGNLNVTAGYQASLTYTLSPPPLRTDSGTRSK